MYTTTSGDSCNDRINDRRLRSGEVAVTEAVAVAVMRGGARRCAVAGWRGGVETRELRTGLGLDNNRARNMSPARRYENAHV